LPFKVFSFYAAQTKFSRSFGPPYKYSIADMSLFNKQGLIVQGSHITRDLSAGG